MLEFFKKDVDIISTDNEIYKNSLIDDGYVKITTEEGNLIISKENDYSRINDLKALLSLSDYKVIKNYELSMAGLQLEYEPITLHNERQLIRNEINILENKWNN